MWTAAQSYNGEGEATRTAPRLSRTGFRFPEETLDEQPIEQPAEQNRGGCLLPGRRRRPPQRIRPYLHPDFTTTAPNYLPWGGFHPGAAFFRDEVLPNLPDILDFGRFSYDVFLAENDRVVALVNFGLVGGDAMIKISEHWTVKKGKATSIWVAYFEPQALLDKLGIVHGLKH
jgi:hypothetical protein